ALAVAALLGGGLRLLEGVDDVEPVARVGEGVEAGDLHGGGGVRGLDALAAVAGDVADAAEGAARDDEVSDGELAVLDEHARGGAAAFLHARLDDDALRRAAEVGLEVEQLGAVVERFEEVLDALAGVGRGADDFGVAAPFGGVEPALGELA